MATGSSRRLTADEAALVHEAEARIAGRLEEAEQAKAEGRLSTLVKDVPSVEEQFRSLKSRPLL